VKSTSPIEPRSSRVQKLSPPKGFLGPYSTLEVPVMMMMMRFLMRSMSSDLFLV